MTSASELFYTRRSRFGRSSLDLGLDPSLDRTFHHHSHTQGNSNRRHNHYHYHYPNQNNNSSSSNTRRDHHDVDGGDPLRRSPLVRHQTHRPTSTTTSERDSIRPHEGSIQSSPNLDNFGGIRNNMRFSGNDRLPGAVLLARERLLERLQGASLSRNRRNNRASPAINRNNLTLGDDNRLVDAGDWETDLITTDSTFELEQLLVPQETTKRPPGLTQETLNRLQLVIFIKAKHGDEGEMSRASLECSICLESFVDGDELMCLPCAHRFHSSCLDPWIRTCGDCPYCRRGVVV